jgi:MFS family permease
LLASNSGAIIADNVPASGRGRAYGFTSIGWNVGAILGIVLGGAIITFINWRFIFYINLPIGIIALVVSTAVLRETAPRGAGRLDIIGGILQGAGLLLILLALTNASANGWGTTSFLMIISGIVVLVGFVIWEHHTPAPLLDFSLFRQRMLTTAILAAFFQALGNYAVLFLLIMYLQGVRGLSPFAAALLLTPGYLIGGFLGPWSGRIADRVGARVPTTLGLGLQIAGILVYSTLGLATSLVVVVIGSVLNGAGSGFFFPANSSAVIANSPPDAYGVASGLLRTVANIGMVGSFAMALLAASSAVSRQQAFAIFLGTSNLSSDLAAAFVNGVHTALHTAIIPMGIALILSFIRGPESRR